MLPSYNKRVGQQHRVRSKRKRRKAYLKRKKKTLRSKQRERKAYLKRKKKTLRSKQRESPKPRSKKEQLPAR
ncbi:MAG: hypothetical protein DMF35_03600 [Verrucomicrobia bacterium]|nr:MAG: hypothetical protein DMF35_03600 [Verrucomicrobiota bacterium]